MAVSRDHRLSDQFMSRQRAARQFPPKLTTLTHSHNDQSPEDCCFIG